MFAVVLVTCPDMASARRVAEGLLKDRLAACINIVSGLKSLFWWKGRLEEADEVLLIIKTRLALVRDLIARVKELHPYEVPEVVALPIVEGSDDYLAWLGEEVREA
mgnify:CR=1 FL=1